MIGIVQKGEFVKGVLDYHYDKIDKGLGEILATNIYSQEYKDQLRFYLNTFSLHDNTRTKNKVFHASLSFSPDEKLSKELMNEIGQEYLHRMGYKEVPFTIFAHTDTNHQHIHIVASRINYDGNLACKSQFDIKRNKEHCKILERKYGLIVAEQKTRQEKKREFLNEINMQRYAVSNGINKAIKTQEISLPEVVLNAFKENSQPTDYRLKDLLGKKFYEIKNELEDKGFINYSKKYQITKVLQKALELSNSQEEFTANCQLNGVYVRKLTQKGVPYFHYGLKNEGYYVTEKYLPERFSFERTKNIALDKEEKLRHIEESRTKQYIKTSLRKIIPAISSQVELEINLKRFGVNFEYDYTKKNGHDVIQGLRLKSENSNIWFKASEIDRNYSWNKIKAGFVQKSRKELNQQDALSIEKTKPNTLTNKQNFNKLPSINENINYNTDKTSEEMEQIKRRRRDKNQEL